MKRALLLAGVVGSFAAQPLTAAGAAGGQADYEYRVVTGMCTQLWQFSTGPQAGVYRFSDIDKDGRPEVLVVSTGPAKETVIEVRTGSRGQVLKTLRYRDFAFTAVVGDVNRDGIADIALRKRTADSGYDDGDNSGGGQKLAPGVLRVISGADGQTLWTVTAPQGETDFGASVAHGADYLVVGAADFRQINTKGTGRVYIVSARSGKTLKVVNGPPRSSWSFGGEVAVAADKSLIVGDAGARGYLGRVYAFSNKGGTMTLRWQAGPGNTGELLFGSPLHATSDVVVGVHNYAEGNGRIVALNGRTGARLWVSEARRPGEHFGQSLGDAGDINADGVRDVLFGAPTSDAPTITLEQGGRFGVLDGRSGKPIVDVESRTQRPDQHTDELGTSVVNLGAGRYVISAPSTQAADGQTRTDVTAFACRPAGPHER